MEKLLLVDGHNLLFRMFYGMPDNFYTPAGQKYNAVFGFASAMKRVLEWIRPTHALVVFDSEDCGDRRALDGDYKANRPDFSEADPNDCPFTQLPAIYALLDRMGIAHREIHGCEADDVIASYAVNCQKDYHVIIFSTDRDYWQLVGERVSILNYHGADSTLVTPATVERKFGVRPEQFADFKCLVGDHSDNVAGVPGVGPKRAAEMLGEYGSLENLLLHIGDIKRPALRKALEESTERLALNKRLICLSGEAPLPVAPDALSCHPTVPRNLMLFAMEIADGCRALPEV